MMRSLKPPLRENSGLPDANRALFAGFAVASGLLGCIWLGALTGSVAGGGPGAVSEHQAPPREYRRIITLSELGFRSGDEMSDSAERPAQPRLARPALPVLRPLVPPASVKGTPLPEPSSEASVGKNMTPTLRAEPVNGTGSVNPGQSRTGIPLTGPGSGMGSSSGSIDAEGSWSGPFTGPSDKRPMIREYSRPLYPEQARIDGISGLILVRVLVSAEGKALRAVIVRRSPADCRLFDEVALRSGMRSAYTPGVVGGKAVKAWLTIPMRFELD